MRAQAPSVTRSDRFGERDLRDILAQPAAPTVSIYLPLSDGPPRADRNRLDVRAALAEARSSLDPEDQEELKSTLDALEVEALEAARGGGGTLALLAASGAGRVYRLPLEAPRLVVVGPTFHTLPLVRFLQEPSRFWALQLGQRDSGLWVGDARRCRRVEPSPIPTDLRSALGYEYARDSELIHRGGSGGPRRAQRGGSVGAFAGHGTGSDDGDAALEKYFRVIDASLREYLGGRRDPVVLAGVGEHHALFRRLSKIESLAPTGITASIRDWAADRVHAEAWPLVRETVEARMERALDLWEDAYGSGKGEMDLVSVGRLAAAGRVRLLLTSRARHIWGSLDPTSGFVEIEREGGADPGAPFVDLLDELTELVLARGGSALQVPVDRMPTPTGAAAILR
ncbi:MAG: hypothetical protein MJB57_09060 [Gemmatimonadetes bacterium]|nr:hypothetical protein [Gemmatimonadota bacterium]